MKSSFLLACMIAPTLSFGGYLEPVSCYERVYTEPGDDDVVKARAVF